MPLRDSKWRFAAVTCIVGALCFYRPRIASSTESLGVETGVTRFSPDSYAYGTSLSLKESGQTGGALFGLSSYEYPVGSLSTVDVDAYRRESSHLTLSGGMSVGTAAGTTTTSTLYKARFAVDGWINPTWSARIADQYIDLDMIRGHLMTVGIDYRPTPKWGLGASSGYAVSGTVADRYGQLSVNWFGTQHLFGGVVLGRSGYDQSNLGETAVVRRLFQVYAGGSFPLKIGTLTVSTDSVDLGGAGRQSLRLGFIESIRP